MKKIRLLLTLLLVVSFLPLNVLAEEINVGVNIEGQLIISAVTTINANVVVDVNNKTVEKSFVTVANTGNTTLNFQIVDIAPADENSPSNFVPFGQSGPVEGKSWNTLLESDTKNYISFGISQGDTNYQSILPDTPVNLGNIGFYEEGIGGSEYSAFGEVNHGTYLLNANTGYVWGTTTNINYYLTTLVSVGSLENAVITNNSLHDFINDDYYDVSLVMKYTGFTEPNINKAVPAMAIYGHDLLPENVADFSQYNVEGRIYLLDPVTGEKSDATYVAPGNTITPQIYGSDYYLEIPFGADLELIAGKTYYAVLNVNIYNNNDEILPGTYSKAFTIIVPELPQI